MLSYEGIQLALTTKKKVGLLLYCTTISKVMASLLLSQITINIRGAARKKFSPYCRLPTRWNSSPTTKQHATESQGKIMMILMGWAVGLEPRDFHHVWAPFCPSILSHPPSQPETKQFAQKGP